MASLCGRWVRSRCAASPRRSRSTPSRPSVRLAFVLVALMLEAGGAQAAARPAPDGVDVERDVVYAERGQRRLMLDVYRPRAATGPAPVLLFVHGGGWVLGTK